MPSDFDQGRYQVRFEWGVAGLDRLAPADVIVVVDVLRFSSAVADRVAAGEGVLLDGVRGNTAPERDAADGMSRGALDGAVVAAHAGARGATVVLGCLRNASAVAAAVLAEQGRRGARTSIAVIAAGELVSRDPSAPLRFAVEDLLGAGAVIDALGALGIDHTSPESAAAGEAFRGLRGALRHLLTASGSGQEMLERGRRAEVESAATLDAVTAVPVLRGGQFRA